MGIVSKSGNTIFDYYIERSGLNLKKEDVEYSIGYRRRDTPSYVREEIDTVWPEVEECDDLYGGFRLVFEEALRCEAAGFWLGRIFFETGEIIASNLKESEYIAVFVATAGSMISEKIYSANRSNDYMKAFIQDAAGSEMAERAADYIHARIEREAGSRGMSITNRYSPGYCGWNVAEQKKLFSFLPEGFSRVSLTESGLMIPIKSVSGVIGMGKHAVRRDYGCAICTMESCYKRQKKYKYTARKE
ncbi:MAG: hypothetical protein JW881_17430 [Spirochaetales bacterium]|nr:hypothetical protein [Spirochaetales bacterium]